MLKITIDAGHTQGANAGAANGYREGTVMYYLALALRDALAEYGGVETALTRAQLQDNPPLGARGRLAIENGSALFLSLHSDASGSAATRGVTVVRSLKRPDSVLLGQKLADAVDGVLGCGKSPYAGADGGVWTRAYPGCANADGSTDYYGVLRSAAAGAGVRYAYLIEHSFHTNPADCAALDADAVRRRIAKAEAAAIAAWFGLEKKGAPGAPAGNAAGTRPGGALYAVQAGAFKSKANAEAYAAQLAEQGVAAYVTHKGG